MRRVPQDVESFIPAVVGATRTGNAEEAGSEQVAFGLEAVDAFLQHGDLPGEQTTAPDALSPAEVGKRDGRGNEEQGLMHRGNYPGIAATSAARLIL